MSGRQLTTTLCSFGLLLGLSGLASASHDWFGVDLCRSNPARMPPVLQAGDLPRPASPGAQLLVEYCRQCHNLPHPGVHTADEWAGVTRAMYQLSEVTARFGGRPELRIPGMAERASIDAYLAEQALRPLPRDTHAPVVYREVCGDCHAAPDPALHSSTEWPAVFARMAGHRVAMARVPLDPLKATQVLAYLSEQAAPAERGTDGGRWMALLPVAALVAFALWRLLGQLPGRLTTRFRRPGRPA